jgi:hypothetical protein
MSIYFDFPGCWLNNSKENSSVYDPSRSYELAIDIIAGNLFGILVQHLWVSKEAAGKVR